MSRTSTPRLRWVLVSCVVVVTTLLAGCAPAPAQPQVVEKTVVVTQEVAKEVVVTKEVAKEVVVTKEVEKQVVVTPTPLPPAAKKGGTFISYIAEDPTSLNGIIGNDGYSLPIIWLSQNPLTLGGENGGSVLAGDLAEKWELSPDGLTWTFYLHKDVKWQDGQPFTADDVLFTFQAIQDEKVQTGGFRDRFMINGKPIKFEKVDDYTIKATLDQPIASFASAISVPIIPKHLLEGQDINKAAFNQLPVGTGPFKVAEWKSGESVTLEANPNYFRGAPYLDKYVYRIIPNQDAAAVALQSGEIDFANVRGKDVARFVGNPDFTVKTAPVDLTRMIILNDAKPFFKDARVRQALSLAVDRQAVIDAAEQGYGTIADSVFDQPVSIYKPGKLQAPQQDLDKANALMKEAGWVDTNGDGIVEKDGQVFKILLEYSPGWTFMAPVAPLIQAWWKKIGVDATVRTYDSASFVDKVMRSSTVDKPFDAFINGWGYFATDPDAYASYFAPSKPGLSFLGYENAQVKDLFDKARVATDPSARSAMYEQAEKILWDDVAFIPLYYPQRIFVYNNRVGLDEAGLDANRFPPFQHPEKLYMRQK